MSIPTRKDLRLPVLRQFAAGREQSSEDVHAAVESTMQMTRSERQKRMKNGVRVFVNRVAWALVDLQREGALVKLRTHSGRRELAPTCVYEITALGRQVLEGRRSIVVGLNYGYYSPWSDGSDAGNTETPRDMSSWCVYAIKATKDLTNAAATGTGDFTEYKRWTSAANLLALAKQRGEKLPIIFAAAEQTRDLIGWAILENIQVSEDGTTYSFTDMQVFAGRRPRKTALRKRSDGQLLPAAFIRSYAICATPPLLRRWPTTA